MCKKDNLIDFVTPESRGSSIIKVIGVGGGGGNAVNHMYRKGIHDVSFVLCNTDAQALNDSPVPVHLQLGKEGLGAGNKPEKARAAAEESMEDIRRMLDDGTRMAFITAGMGGGTGTGAAPVVARASKEMGILTVGIVTIPFRWEGENKIDQALDGVEEMAKHVDALLVINNERLLEIYADKSVEDAFAKADDTLCVAAKSIAEIITVHGRINLDFNDVKTVLENGGVALMSTGYGEGEDRVKKAIDDALTSPLLNNKDVYKSKKLLINISYSNQEGGGGGLMMDEMNHVNDFMASFERKYDIKWGMSVDPELGKKVKITILATGFGISDVADISSREQRLTKEKIEAQAEEDEKQGKRDKRRDKFYGGGVAGGNAVKKKVRIYLFKAEDLDNDNVISAVEDSPTYKRSKDTLRNIESRSVTETGVTESTESTESSESGKKRSEPVQGVIAFT